MIGEVFGIRPWEMVDVRPDQYEAIVEHLTDRAKAAR